MADDLQVQNKKPGGWFTHWWNPVIEFVVQSIVSGR
jgi:hypothetical protein